MKMTNFTKMGKIFNFDLFGMLFWLLILYCSFGFNQNTSAPALIGFFLGINFLSWWESIFND